MMFKRFSPFLFLFCLLVVSACREETASLPVNYEGSPGIARVFAYRPAPGQFVNVLPEWKKGDDAAAMRAKVLQAIGGKGRGLVTLGAYGGYVVFGFDHTIKNVPDRPDFKVLGNAFAAQGDLAAPGVKSGSSEPGIIYVSRDVNRNGLPDDEWYEIAGSETGKPTTWKNYQVTYRRPSRNHAPFAPQSPDSSWCSDADYIPWSDNRSGSGRLPKNIFHDQDYFPQWIAGDSLSFSGIRLAPNGERSKENPNYWVLKSYGRGYADNVPNDDPDCEIDIDDAIDKRGEKAHLSGIDFVKIQTGVLQTCGWLGEVSTEVGGALDLRLLRKSSERKNIR